MNEFMCYLWFGSWILSLWINLQSVYTSCTPRPWLSIPHTGTTQLHVWGEQLFSDSYDIFKSVKKVVSVQSWKTQWRKRCRWVHMGDFWKLSRLILSFESPKSTFAFLTYLMLLSFPCVAAFHIPTDGASVPSAGWHDCILQHPPTWKKGNLQLLEQGCDHFAAGRGNEIKPRWSLHHQLKLGTQHRNCCFT